MLKTATRTRSWLGSSKTQKETKRCRCTNQRVAEDLVIRCGCVEFEESRLLGEGNTSNVRLLKRRKTGQLYATKQFKNFSKERTVFATNVLTEFYIANGLNHPNIIKTFELRTIDGVLNMLMEFAPNNLFEMAAAGAIAVDDAEKYFKQLVAGVAYIHGIGFAHRDIKLENVLVSESGQVKIIDFGTFATGKFMATGELFLSNNSTEMLTYCLPADVGSLPYMAPELFTSQRYHPQPADAWSLAILYACMVLRRFPWAAAQTSKPAYQRYSNALAADVQKGSAESSKHDSGYPWPVSEFPSHMRMVLGCMLHIDPKQRPILEGVPQLLRECAEQ